MAPRRRRRSSRFALLLIAPFFALFAGTIVAPLGYAVWLSVFSEKRSGFEAPQQIFVGLGNYVSALTDPAFLSGFGVLAIYLAVYLPIMNGFALGAALFLDSAFAVARKLFQPLLFLPHAVPGLIAALIWGYLYTPGISPILQILGEVNIHIDLLQGGFVIPSLVNIATWEWTGYNVVIFYTALKAIDRSVLEAARVDGASEWRTAWSVKIPLVLPAIGVVSLFTLIGALQLFSEPQVLSQNSSIPSTFTPNMYAYAEAFVNNNYNLGAAASLILAVICGLVSWFVTRHRGNRAVA